MRRNILSRIAALLLCAAMIAATFPCAVFAYGNIQPQTHTVFRHLEQTLAPGIEYYNNYAISNDDGKQMVYHVAVADIRRDDVIVQTGYKNAQCAEYGMQKLTEQMAASDAKYSDPANPSFISGNYKTVAGVNGDFYDMTSGVPFGAFVMNGITVSGPNDRAWFAIFEDGKAACGKDNAAWDRAISVHGAPVHAVGGNEMLVSAGRDVTASSYIAGRQCRSMVGVTPEGKVVMAVIDGRQEPYSCGGTMHELAQIMLEAGCISAINIDGGGSSTFAARPEGEDSVKLLNRPSDGSERPVSTCIIAASLAQPSDVFDHARIVPSNEYVTPGTSTALTTLGVSSDGSAAPIPEGAIYEATLGTVSNGKFISDGTEGAAAVNLKYNGEVVGSTTVNVVTPDRIAFTSSKYTILYGKTTTLGITAKYGHNTVKTKPSDFTLTTSEPSSGTFDGMDFLASCDYTVTSSTVTASLNGTDLTASAAMTFARESDVIFDFEDGTTDGFALGYSGFNYYLPRTSVGVADRDNGKVHGGDHSLALNIDFSNSQQSGCQKIALYRGGVSDSVTCYTGAASIGAWLWIPDEAVGLNAKWIVTPITDIDEDTGECTLGDEISSTRLDRKAGGTGVVCSFGDSGWHYLSCDLTGYEGFAWRDFSYCIEFSVSEDDGSSYKYYFKDQHNVNGNFTLYLDDVTVDYNYAEDRDVPGFPSVILGDEGPNSLSTLALPDGYVSEGYSKLKLWARTTEYTANPNYTGIDTGSPRAWIDGNEVPCTILNGILSAGEFDFADGRHTVRFAISDNQGNTAYVSRHFTVHTGSSRPTVKIVPHDPTLDRIKHGSLYWVDVVATDIGTVQTVTTTLDLDSMSEWELDHMEVTDGFEAAYTVDEPDKIAHITINRTGEVTASGEAPLVSIPVRAWSLDNSDKEEPLDPDKEWTYAEFKDSREFWPVATEVRVRQGEVTFTGGVSDTFIGEDVFVWSESWANFANMTATPEGVSYFNSWDGGHVHSAQPDETLAPTCTEPGIAGRTYCAVCDSVVEWGSEVSAAGHSFGFVEGLLCCTVCGELFSGVWDGDGKTYVDGAAVQPDVIKGDVDRSGLINVKDLTLLKKVLAGAETLDGTAFLNADMDGDGAITVKDVKHLKHLIAS